MLVEEASVIPLLHTLSFFSVKEKKESRHDIRYNARIYGEKRRTGIYFHNLGCRKHGDAVV